MTASAPKTRADSLKQPSPWDKLATDGRGLEVPDFLTTLVVNTGNALKRHVTLPYAREFGLSMAEWRILSVLAHAREIPFSRLVVAAATDKGQLSRMLRSMQERGLVKTVSEGAGSRKRVTCFVSPQGLKLYNQVMPIARKRQAEMIGHLSLDERRAIYGALRRLQSLCGPQDEDSAWEE